MGSSRSHSVCTLTIGRTRGKLVLVDCAGTERRKDSMHHSKERQQEGAEINASLHALKECIRHLSASQRVPSHVYRGSSLTKVLAGAFTCSGERRLAVLCTISPAATDTEHTVATLRTGLAITSGIEREEKEALVGELRASRPREVHPRNWTPGQVRAWVGIAGQGQFQSVVDSLPSNFTGQMLVRLTESRCIQLCSGDVRRGRLLFVLLHQEIRSTEAVR